MSEEKTKAQAFTELLPEIYYRKIILKSKHRDICQWLLSEHGLDFFSDTVDNNGNKTVPLFGNYLKKYGNLKKAQESYEENIASKLDVENEWWKDYVDENNRPIKPTSVPTTNTSSARKISNVNQDSQVNAEAKAEQEIKPKGFDTPEISSQKAAESKEADSKKAYEQPTKPKDPTRVAEVVGIAPKRKPIDYDKIDPLAGYDDIEL